jgi:GT2 family glycosyltransferase
LRGTRPLLACLEALHASGAGHEVILVDNASADGSVDEACRAFPDVRVVRADRNLGYAGAANLGLEAARAPWCIILNDDAVLAPGSLESILADLNRSSDGAARLIQPTLRRSSDPERFDYAGGAGGLIDRWGYTFALGRLFDRLERDVGQYREAGPLAWASGCCLAGGTETMRALGGFEDGFFAHFEEIDLCWRHRRAGGAVAAAPQAVVYHMGPSTLPAGAQKTYLNFRNSLWMLRRNLSPPRRAWVLVVRLALDAAAALRWLLVGRATEAWAVVRGWRDGLFRRPWSGVVPHPSQRVAGSNRGTCSRSAALAAHLGRARSARDLLSRTDGWSGVVAGGRGDG